MIRKGLIKLIKVYKNAVSPYFIKSCRFEPTCSQYAVEALEVHGLFKGAALALWRVLRCNPFSRGGYEPVLRKEIKTEG